MKFASGFEADPNSWDVLLNDLLDDLDPSMPMLLLLVDELVDEDEVVVDLLLLLSAEADRVVASSTATLDFGALWLLVPDAEASDWLPVAIEEETGSEKLTLRTLLGSPVDFESISPTTGSFD
jgi:hypothetical protein